MFFNSIQSRDTFYGLFRNIPGRTQVSGTNFPEEQLKQWSGCNRYKKAKKIITI